MNSNRSNAWISECILTGTKVHIFGAIPKYYACYYAGGHSTYLKFIDVDTMMSKTQGDYILLKEHAKEGTIHFKAPCSIDNIQIQIKTTENELVDHILGSGKKNQKTVKVSIPQNTDFTLKLTELSADKLLLTKKQGDQIVQIFVNMYDNANLVMKIPLIFLNNVAVPSQYGVLTSYIDITTEEKDECFGDGKLIQERNGKRPDYIIRKGDTSAQYVQNENNIYVLPFNSQSQEVLPPKKQKKKNGVKSPKKNLKTKATKKIQLPNDFQQVPPSEDPYLPTNFHQSQFPNDFQIPIGTQIPINFQQQFQIPVFQQPLVQQQPILQQPPLILITSEPQPQIPPAFETLDSFLVEFIQNTTERDSTPTTIVPTQNTTQTTNVTSDINSQSTTVSTQTNTQTTCVDQPTQNSNETCIQELSGYFQFYFDNQNAVNAEQILRNATDLVDNSNDTFYNVFGF